MYCPCEKTQKRGAVQLGVADVTGSSPILAADCPNITRTNLKGQDSLMMINSTCNVIHTYVAGRGAEGGADGGCRVVRLGINCSSMAALIPSLAVLVN